MLSSYFEFWVGKTYGHTTTLHNNEQTFRIKPAADWAAVC